MKAIQTFWTCKRSLLEHSFWWLNPQCHLMSWALSCLSLRENYDEVILYTDTNGYKVFGELLALPYTDIVVQYDNLHCPEPHWAYAKLKTYSIQKEPFIHIDGDVILPHRLNDSIESAGLIAQNKEISGQHYRGMMDEILQRKLRLPDFLKAAIERESIPSYNAGVLGGNDLDFIQEYCHTAFRIIEDNHLNEPGNPNININHNVFLEQVLFAALAEKLDKPVSTVIDHSIRDDGYTYAEFCNLYKYDHISLLHFIGGHKRRPQTCDLFAKTLLNRYPEYYRRIVELFPEINKRLQEGEPQIFPPSLSIQACIARYQDFLCDQTAMWRTLNKEKLYNWEKKLSVYPNFLNASKEEQATFILGKNPYLSMFSIPSDWSPIAKRLLKERIQSDKANSPEVNDIVCLPCLLGEGYKECLINDLCYNMLALLEEERTFGELCEKLRPSFAADIRDNEELISHMIMGDLEHLLSNGMLYVRPTETNKKTNVEPLK